MFRHVLRHAGLSGPRASFADKMLAYASKNSVNTQFTEPVEPAKNVGGAVLRGGGSDAVSE